MTTLHFPRSVVRESRSARTRSGFEEDLVSEVVFWFDVSHVPLTSSSSTSSWLITLMFFRTVNKQFPLVLLYKVLKNPVWCGLHVECLVGLKRTLDQKLSSGLLLTFMTTHLFQVHSFMVCFLSVRNSFANQVLSQAKVRQRHFDAGFFSVRHLDFLCPGVTPDFDIFVSSTGNFNIGTSDQSVRCKQLDALTTRSTWLTQRAERCEVFVHSLLVPASGLQG